MEINYTMPAHSTFPVQDKFNQVHMFTGLTKLEWMAGQVAAGMISKDITSNIEQDVIVDEIVTIAKKLLSEIQKESEKKENLNIIK